MSDIFEKRIKYNKKLYSKLTKIDKKDLLLYALTYNSIIDHEELNYIKSCINKEKTK